MSTPDKGDPRRPEPRRDLPLLNERIRDREVRLIDEDGTQLGIVPTREALATAKEKGLDLFLVQPDANPPVARILDYGRFKFEQEKKTRETKRKHHVQDVKRADNFLSCSMSNVSPPRGQTVSPLRRHHFLQTLNVFGRIQLSPLRRRPFFQTSRIHVQRLELILSVLLVILTL